METNETARPGVLFTLSLLNSWTVGTGAISMLGWIDQHSSERIATWVGVWIFTIAVPTVQATRINSVLSELRRDGRPLSPRSRRILARAQVLILICGSMTALLLYGLFVNR
jgi:hypothetical protein